MKNLMKRITTSMLAVMMIGTVSACGTDTSAGTPVGGNTTDEVTMESLMKGFSEKVKAGSGLSYKTAVDIDTEVTTLGELSVISSVINGIMETDGNNTHVKMASETVSGSVVDKTENESYIVKDGNDITKYDLIDGNWIKSEEKNSDEYNLGLDEMTEIDLSTASMETTDTEYIIKAQIPYENVDNTIPGDAKNVLEGEGNIDPKNNKANDMVVEYHFDKNTKDIRSISIDMASKLNKKTDEIESSGDKTNEPIDTLNVFSMNIVKFIVIMNDFDFSERHVELPSAILDLNENTSMVNSDGDVNSETVTSNTEESPAVESSGEIVESSGEMIESSGEMIESSGEVVESSGEFAESTGEIFESSGEIIESSGETIIN